MQIDKYRCVITSESYPGCVGDSCANTARLAIAQVTASPQAINLSLDVFRTDEGYVRHPIAPYGPPEALSSWREPDFSSDAALPLLMTYDLCWGYRGLYHEMCMRVKWHTAPGKLSSPGVMALARDWVYAFVFVQLIQVILFWLPYRWSDDERLKDKFWKLEKTEGHTGDYLNFATGCQYLKMRGFTKSAKCLLWLAGEEKVRVSISNYFSREPNMELVVRPQFLALDEVMRA